MSEWGNICFREGDDFRAGAVLVVDKPLRWTSFDVVNKSEKRIREDKSGARGYAGSLGDGSRYCLRGEGDEKDRGVYGTGERVRGGDHVWAYYSFL